MLCLKLRCALLLVFSASLFACVAPPPVPQKTQLEIRQIQTREYERLPGGATRIMKAVISVLQDEGYIVRNADKDLGFITAAKETDIQDEWERIFSQFSNGEYARFRKNSIAECLVSVSEIGSRIRVRAVFQVKVQDNMGGTVSVQQLDDPAFYQDFFAKVDKGIFLEKERL
jgi:hypothetical protein